MIWKWILHICTVKSCDWKRRSVRDTNNLTPKDENIVDVVKRSTDCENECYETVQEGRC
jgi:hypothetical protein